MELGSTVANDDVPFKLMPARFLPDVEWRAFAERVGGEERAVELLSRSGLGFHAYNADGSEQALYEDASRYRVALLRLLQKGDVTASGLPDGALALTHIVPERWYDLTPNFLNNSAAGAGTSVKSIAVRAAPSASPKQQMLAQVMDFLTGRKEMGDDPKKETLRTEAEKRFPSLPKRVFDAAYKAVFDKKRGRNRRS